MSHTDRLPWQSSFPCCGSYCVCFIPEVSFICPLILLRWQIWLTCKASSSKKRRKKKKQHQGEGAAGDGSISLEDLTKALGSLPRSKAPGFDGLPYEFYQRFWEQLGPELTAVLQEAFQPDGPGQLPSDMTEGRITLLYKGKGFDRAIPASYRPITLLNTEYKLAARVLANRLGLLLNHVIDSTQTAFLPQRWIGDNILAHLEIIASYQRAQQPGVLLFLDFEKAFDRMDRPWQRCMAATGFGAGAQRWVSLLHAGTTAKVAFNGWHTHRCPV